MIINNLSERFEALWPKILPPDLKTFVYFFFAHPHNYDSNWKKILGFRNIQEKLEKEHLTMNKNNKVRSLSIWWMCCLSHYLMITIIIEL